MINKIKGFTLIEMLVVIALLSIFGIFFLTIFTRSLRGSNKSQIIGRLKQNGQSILEQMDKTIRNSDNVVCTSNPVAGVRTTLVVVQNGKYTRYRFIPSLPSGCTGSGCTTNGFIQQDFPTKQQISDPASSLNGKEETETLFKNRICTIRNNDMQGATILTDTNPQTGISVDNGLFELNPSPGYKNQVTIKFDLYAGVGVPPSLSSQIDKLSFQTTVQLR